MTTAQFQAAGPPYALHRDYVLSVLARRCGWLDAGDREAAFHDAYAVMLEKQRDGALDTEAMRPEQVRAYLVQTAIHKALDEGKRAHRKRSEPLGEDALDTPDPAAAPEDLAAARLDTARVREIMSELSRRQQTIVKLRFFFDRTPEEIQSFMGLTERVYRRDLERGLRLISERYELVREGRFCDSRRSVILAYVAGIAGPNRARDARRHLATCPGCSSWAASLRDATQRAAAVAPLPLVAAGGPIARAADALAAAHHQLAALGAGAKHQAAALAARIDPSAAYVTGARPGAVAAVAAGCLAVGGGATYCAVEGLPKPLRGLVQRDAPRRRAPERPREAPRAPTVPPTARTATPEPPRAPSHKAAALPQAERRRAARARRAEREEAAAANEFGLEGSGAPAGGGAPAPAPTPTPAPQPPGEFDP